MGDFLLDLRPREMRCNLGVLDDLKFASQQKLHVHEADGFRLIVSCSSENSIWSPHVSAEGSIFAVAGMCVIEDRHWMKGFPEGAAGLALRSIFLENGSKGLEALNGNCAWIVFDANSNCLHLVTDCAGAFPVFECCVGDHRIFGSHPDVVARVAGVHHEVDEVSATEFLMASTVTPPFTLYSEVRFVEQGSHLTMDCATETITRRVYFDLCFEKDSTATEADLAGELAETIRNSVQRRAHPRFGRPCVALSGGLDSRLLLACLPNPESALSFTLYDEPNRELETAAAVAASLNVPFSPIRRSVDYYGEYAELGTRVSGGMGTFANNHFLGVLDQLHGEGMEVLLTGCYVDYLFKGLPLNRREHWLTGRAKLAPFSDEFYFGKNMVNTELSRAVRERWNGRFPDSIRSLADDAEVFEVEKRRTFPLCYEGDNQQRVVPQRLTGWFPPMADRDVIEVYRRIPGRMKLNRSIFLKAAHILTKASPVSKVPDANTGALMGASFFTVTILKNWSRLQRKLKRKKSSLGSDGSWPNWDYYLTHSPKMKELWERPCESAFDFFHRALGWSDIPRRLEDFSDGRVFQFVPLLTQKLWFEQWQCSNGSSN